MRLLLIVFILLTGCSRDFEEYTVDDISTAAEPDITIAELRTFYDHGGQTTFSRDYTIAGTVIADDRSGNFYRSFIIDDGTGAVEIKAGTYDSYTLYPVGRRVSVHLTGMTYGQDDGMAQLGLKGLASSGYEVDFMQHDAIIERFVSRGETGPPPAPQVVYIQEIRKEDIGRLVTIRGLTLEGGGELSWGMSADESYNGLPQSREIKAVSQGGYPVYIFTSGYADFASEIAPAGEVSVTGIVARRNNSSYRIRIRDLNDVE